MRLAKAVEGCGERVVGGFGGFRGGLVGGGLWRGLGGFGGGLVGGHQRLGDLRLFPSDRLFGRQATGSSRANGILGGNNLVRYGGLGLGTSQKLEQPGEPAPAWRRVGGGLGWVNRLGLFSRLG